MLQALGYIRRSTDRQDESLDQQRDKLHAFAKSKGWHLVEVFSDDAISGSDMNRPGLRLLLERVEADASIVAVIAWDRNRLARPKDPIEGMMLERRILSAGKRVLYAATGQEADRSFVAGLIGYVEHHQNGDYLRKLSRDTMRGIVNKVQRGLWPGGPIPFGYDRLILDGHRQPRRIVRDLDDGSQLVIDPATGAELERLPKGRSYTKQEHETCLLIPSDPARVHALQKMFIDYASGIPTRALRDALNAAGFRTSRGSRFTVQTILPMLENPAYLGQCVYNRRTLSKWHVYRDGNSVERIEEGIEKRPESDWVKVDNAWPALVDAGTFQTVQQRRQSSRQKHRQTVGSAIHANYALTGLFFCGVCGSKMIGQTTTSGKGYRTRYYVCSGHHAGKDVGHKRYSVPADLVENHVYDLIRTDLVQLRDDDQVHEQIKNELEQLTGGSDDSRGQLQRRLVELDQQTAKLRDHLLAMDPQAAKDLGLYEQAKLVSQSRQDVERELAKRTELPKLPGEQQIRAMAAKAFDRLEATVKHSTLEERRAILATYVQMIKADPDHHSVEISLYPALFSLKIAGVGFEPTTSGL